MARIQDLLLLPSAGPRPKADPYTVQGNFCNLRDSHDLPMFTIFLWSLWLRGDQRFQEWLQILQDAGTTHVDVSLGCQYPENLGWIDLYPIGAVSVNITMNLLQSYGQMLAYIEDLGMIPHVHLAWDDQGFDWGVNHLHKVINALPDHVEKVVWDTGFDGCFPTWSPQQTSTAINLLRTWTTPKAVLATEFAGPGNIPYIDTGGGAADFYGPLKELNILLLEFGSGQFDNQCGMQQIAARVLGPKAKFTPIPGCDRQNPPFYFGAQREQPITVCAYEWLWGGAYTAIRKQTTPQDAQVIAGKFRDYGYYSFGNGQPQ